jgi:hypothetical protein
LKPSHHVNDKTRNVMNMLAQPLVEPTLGDQICTLYARINLATYHLLTLIAEFDETRSYAHQGCLSTAHWLNYRCSIGLTAAREKVRVARRLSELPQICEAFAAGRLSYSKVRALTRAATPDTEARLLNIAYHSTAAQTEKILRQYRQCQTVNTTDRDPPSLTYYTDSSGDLVFKGRLASEQGALLLKALELMRDGTGQEKVSPAEALVLTAEAAIQSTSDGQSSSADRFQIHVDLTTPTDGCGPTVEGTPIADVVLERILCDPSLVAHRKTEDGNLVPSTKRRLVSGPMRRALRHRDGGCRFPGCTQSRFVDAHHILHWARGGETKLSNLVLLCRRHHGLIHTGDFRACREEGDVVFRTHDGVRLPGVADVTPIRAGDGLKLKDSAEASIHPRMLTPKLDHKPPDYRYISSVLLQ